MSLPNIPDITPEIDLKRKDAINLLLASIAQEELGLSHIINAEGEKIQKGICLAKCIDDLIHVNRTVEKMLERVIKKEMLLLMKLDQVLELIMLGSSHCDCDECGKQKHKHHHDSKHKHGKD